MTGKDRPTAPPETLDLFADPPVPAGRPPDPPGPPVWTVTTVNRAVRELLETAFPPIVVAGEVGGWTRARSGHCYFTLKDDRSQLRCVLWKRDAGRLPIDPEEGMRIRVHGTVTLYEARGEFQLVARVVETEEGEGLWRLAFERLRTRLDEEGLLAPERKRPLPPFPGVVGVVTSTTGAALRDILSVIARRAPWTRVVVRGTRVQGEGAGEEVARALDRLAASGLPDVIIIGRGGGSIEDLWTFNEEPVARAIARCPIPVISAVGHEVDVTISDLVADLRAATPSAAAEAAVPDGARIQAALQSQRPRLARGLQRGVERRRSRLTELDSGLVRSVRWDLDRRRQVVRRIAGTLNALSPLSTLERGFAVPLAPDGTLLRRSQEFLPGQEFLLRVVDGRIRAVARDIEPMETNRG